MPLREHKVQQKKMEIRRHLMQREGLREYVPIESVHKINSRNDGMVGTDRRREI